MNYLAHIYLSGDNEPLTIGNFIGDSVKGKKHRNFPAPIQKGILLHRKIDSYTDSHPLVFQSSHRLFPYFRHYSSVIIDVLYDHFLARNWTDYHSQSLENYTAEFYGIVERNWEILPEGVRRFFPIMKRQDWLLRYADLGGLEFILEKMTNRVKGDFRLAESVPLIKKEYPLYQDEFFNFFEDLKGFVERQLKKG